jgi:hypothetical protein
LEKANETGMPMNTKLVSYKARERRKRKNTPAKLTPYKEKTKGGEK